RAVGEASVPASALSAPDTVVAGAWVHRQVPLALTGTCPAGQWIVAARAGDGRAATVNASVKSARGIVTGRRRHRLGARRRSLAGPPRRRRPVLGSLPAGWTCTSFRRFIGPPSPSRCRSEEHTSE